MNATPSSWEQIRAWRRQQRQQLIAARLESPLALRLEQGEAARGHLRNAIAMRAHRTMGIYWPMKGEIDLRDLAREHVESGGVVALPVVVQRAAPVEFWRWEPGMRMSKGIWDIPIPAERERVEPDLMIVPLVGFDSHCFRLGYGGGYYDRTIAAATPRPLCVGIGFAAAELPSIFPQPHDMPMRLVVTERGVIWPSSS